MAFTDKFGNSESKFGNIGFALGTTYNGTVYNESASNSLTLAQNAVCNKVSSLTASNALTLSQTATKLESYVEVASSTLSLSQEADFTHLGADDAANTLTLVGTVAVQHYWKLDVVQSIVLSQSIDSQATFLRALTQPLTLTELANVSFPIEVSQSLSLVGVAIGIETKAASNALAFSQTATFNRTVAVHPSNSLALSHAVVLSKSVGRSPISVFGIGDHLDFRLSRHYTATSSLTLTQEMYQKRTNENDASTLTLSQVAGVQRIITRSVHHVLALSPQVVVHGQPFTLSVSHTLVFKQSHDRPTGISAQPFVSIPSGYVVKVPDVRMPDPCYPYRGRLTLLELGNTSIILPTAEFNDSQGPNGRLNIKRAMNGHRRIYHRKMGIAQKLHYDFIIDRRKAIELRQFLIQANSVPIKLTNWKGEVWTVLLTNSPFTFTEDSYWGPGSALASGNKSSITLEFEGARIN